MANKVQMRAVFTNHQNPEVRGVSKRGRIFSTIRYNYEVGVVEDSGFRVITTVNSKNALKRVMKRMKFAEWSVVKAEIEETPEEVVEETTAS
jgi:hypothetical protein